MENLNHFVLRHSNPGAFQVALVVKNPTAYTGDIRSSGLIPWLGRSPGGGHDNPLLCSCLENPMDRGAWQAIVHGAKSQTGLKLPPWSMLSPISDSLQQLLFLTGLPFTFTLDSPHRNQNDPLKKYFKMVINS